MASGGDANEFARIFAGYSVLVVDPNAVLPVPITSHAIQAVTGRYSQLLYIADAINPIQFSQCYGPQAFWAGLPSRRRVGSVKNVLGPTVPKRPYHASHYNGYRYISQFPVQQ